MVHSRIGAVECLSQFKKCDIANLFFDIDISHFSKHCAK